MLSRNLVANFLGQGWSGLVTLAFVPVYVKYLGMESYGLIGVFTLLTALLSLLDAGMTPTLSREMARYCGGVHSILAIRDLLRSVECIAAAAAVAVGVAIGTASGWIASQWLRADQLPLETVSQALCVLGIVIALRFLEGVYRSCLIGLQKQVRLNAVASLMSTIRALGAVAILAWLSPTIQAFFIWQGVVSLVTLLVLQFMTYRVLARSDRAGRFSWESLRGVARFAGGVLGGSSLALLLTQIDKLLLSRMLDLSGFGYYALATTAAGTIALLGAPIVQAWNPRLSQLHAQGNFLEFARTFHMGAQLISVIVGSSGIVLAVFSDTIMNVWTQDSELARRTSKLVSILAAGGVLNALMWMPYQAQIAHGWTGLLVRTNLVAVLAIVPALLWAVPVYGALGAAWIWVALNVGYVLVGAHYMFRRMLNAEKFRWYLRDLFAPLAAALAVCMAWRALAPESASLIVMVLWVFGAAVTSLLCAALTADTVRERFLRYWHSHRAVRAEGRS